MTFNDLFETELLRLADARLADLIEALTNNASVNTIEDYRYRMGQIDALRSTLPYLCEEARAALAARR